MPVKMNALRFEILLISTMSRDRLGYDQGRNRYRKAKGMTLYPK